MLFFKTSKRGKQKWQIQTKILEIYAQQCLGQANFSFALSFNMPVPKDNG